MNDNEQDMLSEEEEFDLIPDVSAATDDNVKLFYMIMNGHYSQGGNDE
jgi:hypothetical protein